MKICSSICVLKNPCKESLDQFLDEDDNIIIKPSFEPSACNFKKKIERKPAVRGLAYDAFFALSHTLRVYSDLITYLLDAKK